MSGRSGYGRSRIVGKLIHLPANMNMAGLAPRVGKPGWAIRLYYQRVDECFCCMPIKIIRRIFVTGNSITNFALNSSFGLIPSNVIQASPSGGRDQAFYGIIFDRKIELPASQTSFPSSGNDIPLIQVPLDGQSSSVVATLTINDYLNIIGSEGWGPVGQTFNINLGDKPTVGTNWSPVNQATGTTSIIGPGTGSGIAAYLVTNPQILGGYGILFNITKILNSSHLNASNNVSGITKNTQSLQNQFRSNLLAMTTGGNNISTTYTPGLLTTPENCIPGQLTVSAPIGSFAIADTTGQPPLELLA